MIHVFGICTAIWSEGKEKPSIRLPNWYNFSLFIPTYCQILIKLWIFSTKMSTLIIRQWFYSYWHDLYVGGVQNWFFHGQSWISLFFKGYRFSKAYHSQTHQRISCRQSDLGSSRSMVFRNICLQNSPRGGGRVSISGPRPNILITILSHQAVFPYLFV